MNKHQPSMNPKSPARTLRRGYCLAQAMIQWCFSPLARIRWCLILIGWSWGGTISPATPPEGNEWKRPSFNANSNQWQVNSVTQASHAQLVDKTPLDSLPELNMSNRMEEYGSSSPMVCAIWRKNMFSLRQVGTRAVIRFGSASYATWVQAISKRKASMKLKNSKWYI